MQDVFEILEFFKIKESLASYCLTSLGKSKVNSLRILPKKEMEGVLLDLKQAQDDIDIHGHFPLRGGKGVASYLGLAKKGYVLMVEQILSIYQDLVCQKALYGYAVKLEETDAILNKIHAIPSLEDILDEIEAIMDEFGTIKDDASPELRRIRKDIIKTKKESERVLSHLVEKYAPYLSDSTLTLRDGKYVLPISLTYKNKVKGIALDISNSGESVFIEPMELVELDQALSLLEAQEKKEINRLLSILSCSLASCDEDIIRLDEFIGDLDFLQAKVLYGESLHGSIAVLSDDGSLFLPKARHPLLDQTSVISNDFAFLSKQKVIVVSGPNAGGKTVALKTLGINALLFQCGMFVIADNGSILPYFKHIFLDIGDSQSLEDNLSTFSGHMSNIASILSQIGGNDLVLLDEVGTGTSPKEGEALAISIIEYLLKKHSYAMVSSHFEGVKLFALSHKEVGNACMLYDEVELRPTYLLKMGLPGESYGLSVAKRFGIQQEVIDRANALLKEQGDFSVSKAISKLTVLAKENETLKKKMEQRERSLIKQERELAVASKNLDLRREKFLVDLEEEKKAILESAQEEVDDIIASLNSPEVKLHEAIRAKKKLQELNVAKDDLVYDEEIWVDDYVLMPSFGISGRVASIRGKKASISTPEGKSFVVDVTSLQKTSVPEKKKEALSGVMLDAISEMKGLPLEINLIGLHYDEARNELEHYLDQCRQKGFKRVRIIHGYGTGTLRKLTQEYCKSHANWIQSYEAAGEQEGGSGATIVHLK